MAFPRPLPGLVIRYSYLWLSEHRRGQEEGVKDRPCAIVLSSVAVQGRRVVTVLPITHTPPAEPDLAVEFTAVTKRRLGLDDEPSWVLLSEANRFVWPGPDLRPSSRGDAATVVFGPLPYKQFEVIRRRFLDALRARRAIAIQRTE